MGVTAMIMSLVIFDCPNVTCHCEERGKGGEIGYADSYFMLYLLLEFAKKK